MQSQKRPQVLTAGVACALLATALFGGAASASSRQLQPGLVRPASFSYPGAESDAKTLAWPQVGFDPGHSGYNPHEKTISPSNVAGLSPLWSTNVGNPTGGLVSANGVLYGVSNNLLIALNSSTGAIDWTAPASGTLLTPAVAGKVVLAICGGPSGTAGFCGYNATNGTQVWSFLCQCALGNPPTVDGKLAYGELLYGGTTFQAVRAATGTAEWNVAVGNHCINSGGTADPVGDGAVYYTVGCQGSDGHTSICAFNAQTGASGWCTPIAIGGCGQGYTQGVIEAKGTLFANVAAAGSCSVEQLAAFNAKTGVEKWTVNLTATNLHYQPALAKGVIYDYDAAGIQAFSASNGTLLWTQSEGTTGPYGHNLSVANGVVYAGCSNDELCALDAKNGNILWTYNSGGQGSTTPIILDGVVYAGCAIDYYCAFGLSGNKRR